MLTSPQRCASSAPTLCMCKGALHETRVCNSYDVHVLGFSSCFIYAPDLPMLWNVDWKSYANWQLHKSTILWRTEECLAQQQAVDE